MMEILIDIMEMQPHYIYLPVECRTGSYDLLTFMLFV